MSGTRVLVVDDEPQIRRALRLVLRANEYVVVDVDSGEAALDALATQPFSIVVLDLSLPDLDGIEVCRRIRQWSRIPVLVLSVHGEEEIKIRALREGADDYVTKPFSAPELLARMESALRRASWEDASAEPVLRAGDGMVVIDLVHRQVARDDREVHLTPIEYELLAFLARHAGRVITHGQLLRSALGPSHEDSTGALRVHVASLRKKLEEDPAHPQILVTEPGIGYRLRLDPPTPRSL